jgi:hypothetical protein
MSWRRWGEGWRRKSSITKLIMKEEAIEFKIQEYWECYHVAVKKSFLNIAYEHLTKKIFYNGIEYRFLSWLNHSYNYDISINLPFVPNPVPLLKNDFIDDYAFNSHRLKLFTSLEQDIEKLKTFTKVKSFTVLIGGSYTDKLKDSPNDIDIAILVPDSVSNNIFFNDHYSRAQGILAPPIDNAFLPEDYNYQYFKAYSRIIMLGNKPKFSNKNDEPIENNFFYKRDIVKIII